MTGATGTAGGPARRGSLPAECDCGNAEGATASPVPASGRLLEDRVPLLEEVRARSQAVGPGCADGGALDLLQPVLEHRSVGLLEDVAAHLDDQVGSMTESQS